MPASAASSHFDDDAEGWRAVGDSLGPLAWIGSGGNPGGHVKIDDQVLGGVTYFVAPAKFLGNQSAALGNLLRFDLMQVYAGSPSQFDATDVLLSGGGLTLAYDFGTHPANGSWTSYAVPLAAGGWRLGTLPAAWLRRRSWPRCWPT